MKIRATVDITQDIDVEVTLDDVMGELASLDAPQRQNEALRLLSLCFTAVKKVPDAIVAEMTEVQRTVIVDALKAQLERYSAT